ncbi:hypothetical protein J1N35_038296 [Gossypium stocksii]|uniref:DUF4218 domain-containing protein n=1 Tax=Gossypium stocksii TaxID=47602 RepID=A0A9D3ULR6_9ROSI|nr:hypothetical protein J1N35_038296 [Gossypium stocksii]
MHIKKNVCDNVVGILLNLSREGKDNIKRLCAKSIDPEEVDQIQIKVVLTLCEMEKIFPPSFFIVMIHLIIHLLMEVKLGGHVQYMRMYSIERYIIGLKASVQNRAYLEGSITEGTFLESQQAAYDSIQMTKRTEDKWLVEKFPKWLAN